MGGGGGGEARSTESDLRKERFVISQRTLNDGIYTRMNSTNGVHVRDLPA